MERGRERKRWDEKENRGKKLDGKDRERMSSQ